MAEELKEGLEAGAPEDAAPVTHEVPTDAYLKELHDFNENLKALAKQREDGMQSDKELSETVQKMAERVKRESEKNTPVTPSESNFSAKGVSWKALMKRRTHDPDILRAQELMDDVAIKGIAKASLLARAGYDIPGVTEKAPINPTRIPSEILMDCDEAKELAWMREKASGSWWDTTTSGAGSDWIQTGFTRRVQDFYFHDADWVSLLEQVMIPQGIGPMNWEVETARGQAQLETEQTALTNPAANFVNSAIVKQEVTAVRTLTPNLISAGRGGTLSAIEDIAVDSLGRWVRNSQMAVRRGVRQCVINGQTASDATLDDAPATSGLETADGYSDASGSNSFRLQAVVSGNTSSSAGDLTFDELTAGRVDIGAFGASPEELFYLLSPIASVTLVKDDDLKPMYAFGSQATVVRGAVMSLAGSPVFLDSEMPDTMDANGINAGTGAKGGALIVNRRRWAAGTARTLSTDLIPQAGYDSMWVVSRTRFDSVCAVNAEGNVHFITNVG